MIKLDNKIDFNDKNQIKLLNWDVVVTHNSYIEFKIIDSEIPQYPRHSEAMIFKDFYIPMAVYKIEGYTHCEYGDGSHEDTYICPRESKPSLDNLVPFDSKNWSKRGFCG
jgi:hypothetical protein